jgi:hypothetical protein
MEKETRDIWVASPHGDHNIEPVTKFTWKCLTCGRVWFSRENAKFCKHEDSISTFRGNEIKCLRKEDIKP